MAEDDNDKQYEASQRKLDRAREKGDIAKSPDFVSALVLVALAGALSFQAGPLAKALGALFVAGLQAGPDTLASPQAVWRESTAIILPVMALILAAGAGVALLASGVTQGIRLAPSKLMPDLKRINPMSGFKSRFGREALTGFLLGQLKLWAILAVALYIYGGWTLRSQAQLIELEPGQTGLLAGREILKALLIFSAVTVGFAGADYLMKVFQFRARMRMSRQELIDEHKESDGDPQMKHQRRQRGQEIALNKMMSEVPKSDVVIVNPTHYAVALKWSRKKGSVPVVVAKGTDEVAARIRHAAQIAGVPIHSDPPTARAIHATVALGREIQSDHFRAVAIAIRFAEQIRQKARRRIIR